MPGSRGRGRGRGGRGGRGRRKTDCSPPKSNEEEPTKKQKKGSKKTKKKVPDKLKKAEEAASTSRTSTRSQSQTEIAQVFTSMMSHNNAYKNNPTSMTYLISNKIGTEIALSPHVAGVGKMVIADLNRLNKDLQADQ